MIAIENVRLFDEVQARTEELSESLRQQTATAEVLKTISRTAFDLQRVLETLLENAVRICGAKHGMIFRYDGECCRAAADYNAPPGSLELWERSPIRAGRGTAVGRALLERRPVHIPDVQADPEYDFPEAQKRTGHRTVLAVPLLREGVPLGTIGLWKTEVAPFTDKQIELLTTFADQAVIAIENVRLFDEIQDKNRQLAEASEHKSQFLASMSHELRTPLNAIIGLTEMMVTNAARFGTEKALEPLRRVNAAGTHLLSLINEVLDLSKIEAGKLELNPEPVNLARLIDEVIGTAGQLAEKNQNRLVVEAQENLGALNADSMRLKQILLNLLSNACKFTKEGEVALRVRKVADGRDWVELAVADTGIGMTVGAAGETVPGIHPGRFPDRAPLRRDRARPCPLAQARAHDGRRRDRDERAGQGFGVYRAPAGRRDTVSRRIIISVFPPFVVAQPRPRDTRSISARTRRSTISGRFSSSQLLSIGRSNSLTTSSSVRPLRACAVRASASKAASTAAVVAAERRPRSSIAGRRVSSAGAGSGAAGASVGADSWLAAAGWRDVPRRWASIASISSSVFGGADAAAAAGAMRGGGVTGRGAI